MSSIITAGVTPAIIPFNFEGTAVRVIDRNGEPWWFHAEVCAVLEIANAGNASSRLDEDEKATIQITDSGNLNADRTIINESGLWSLVLTSRKPAAKRFKKWITSEVIPSIRKTGSYTAIPTLKPKRVRKPAFDVAFKRCMNVLAFRSDLDENQKMLAASRGTYELSGINPMELMGCSSIAAPDREVYFTPTELGNRIGLSGQKMNQAIAASRLQIKINDDWSMTERGLPFGRMFDTTRKGGKGSQQQLKWKASVLEEVRPFTKTLEPAS